MDKKSKKNILKHEEEELCLSESSSHEDSTQSVTDKDQKPVASINYSSEDSVYLRTTSSSETPERESKTPETNTNQENNGNNSVQKESSKDEIELRKKRDRRQNVIKEILETEATYLDFLQITITSFKNPLSKRKDGAEYCNVVFQNIQAIQNLHWVIITLFKLNYFHQTFFKISFILIILYAENNVDRNIINNLKINNNNNRIRIERWEKEYQSIRITIHFVTFYSIYFPR
jgi:hypothetical protein